MKYQTLFIIEKTGLEYGEKNLGKALSKQSDDKANKTLKNALDIKFSSAGYLAKNKELKTVEK